MRIETNIETANSWLIENTIRPPFCQSFEWEEILSREGREVERLSVFDEHNLVAMAFVEYWRLPLRFKYAFCPKGPIFEKNLKDQEKVKAINAIVEFIKNKNCIFFRLEPKDIVNDNSLNFFRTIDVNPRATMILDLKKTPDEILAGMHQKTRYNINLSQKKNLRVSDQKDADMFMKMMKETARRDKFRLHEERHYHEIIFSPLSYQLTVFSADKPVASAVFVGYGDTFTYVFGASDYENRSLMAPYLIQWEGIKMAQRFGYRYYDFFGVAPRVGGQLSAQDSEDGAYEYDLKHQYAGVTRFKQGFGGEYSEGPGTYDLIISLWKYRLYQGLRILRRLF